MCILVALVIGVGLGLTMGAMIHYLNMPPFITTLTGMFLAPGRVLPDQPGIHLHQQ